MSGIGEALAKNWKPISVVAGGAAAIALGGYALSGGCNGDGKEEDTLDTITAAYSEEVKRLEAERTAVVEEKIRAEENAAEERRRREAAEKELEKYRIRTRETAVEKVDCSTEKQAVLDDLNTSVGGQTRPAQTAYNLSLARYTDTRDLDLTVVADQEVSFQCANNENTPMHSPEIGVPDARGKQAILAELDTEEGGVKIIVTDAGFQSWAVNPGAMAGAIGALRMCAAELPGNRELCSYYTGSGMENYPGGTWGLVGQAFEAAYKNSN